MPVKSKSSVQGTAKLVEKKEMQGEKVCSLCWAGPGQVKIHVAEHSFQEAAKLVEKKELQGEKVCSLCGWPALVESKSSFQGAAVLPIEIFNEGQKNLRVKQPKLGIITLKQPIRIFSSNHFCIETHTHTHKYKQHTVFTILTFTVI